MSTPGSRNPLRIDLRYLLTDVSLFGFMVGVGEAYFQAFALQIGASDAVAGLLATIPLLGGAVFQLISPRGVARIGSFRRWVVIFATIQSFAFIPLVIGAYVGRLPVALLFVIAIWYWGSGMATGPAWNTWIGKVVPNSIKARYFSRHSRLAQITVLTGILGAGFALEYGKAHDRVLDVFAIMFLVAGMCRFLSSRMLSCISEPVPPHEAGHRAIPPMEIIQRFLPRRAAAERSEDDSGPKRHGPWEGRVLLYFLVMMAAVQIANPFITPFILDELQTGYAQFTILLAVVFLAKAVALPIWGRVAKRYGPKRLLWIGGTMVIPLPALWMFSSAFPYLVFIQVLTGISAAAYEFGIFLLFFETIHERDRTSILTFFNLANAIANIGGSVAGGIALRWLGESQLGYFSIFIASTAARALALVFLAQLSGVRLVPMDLFVRAIGVRIGLGSIDRPVMVKTETDLMDTGEVQSREA